MVGCGWGKVVERLSKVGWRWGKVAEGLSRKTVERMGEFVEFSIRWKIDLLKESLETAK